MLKINFLGDSITFGYGTSSVDKRYVNLVGKLLKAETRCYGVNGTGFTINPTPLDIDYYNYYFASRIEEMNHDADIVFVFGGTNDYGHSDAPMGKLGDKTLHTFYGAVDYSIRMLLKHYKKDQIVFILPLYRLRENSSEGDGRRNTPALPLQKYRDAICEVANVYDIRVLDIKDRVGKAENNPYLLDGLHPNDNGHVLLANLITEYIKNNYLV